ncbi:uncharacterized protein LOC131438792 [Malaya genurostris]|uniref:uncharacterized protein LOC131438792 n=1 Tax=Malaya genurostris TaxID=325434 RepID=UPI0026F409C0|nr:uncharacterized protein LOC131438792 [Malaya genurostris]
MFDLFLALSVLTYGSLLVAAEENHYNVITIRDIRCPRVDDPMTPYLLPHMNDCSKFLSCYSGLAYELICPEGLHFGVEKSRCDYPEDAKCSTVRPASYHSSQDDPSKDMSDNNQPQFDSRYNDYAWQQWKIQQAPMQTHSQQVSRDRNTASEYQASSNHAIDRRMPENQNNDRINYDLQSQSMQQFVGFSYPYIKPHENGLWNNKPQLSDPQQFQSSSDHKPSQSQQSIHKKPQSFVDRSDSFDNNAHGNQAEVYQTVDQMVPTGILAQNMNTRKPQNNQYLHPLTDIHTNIYDRNGQFHGSLDQSHQSLEHDQSQVPVRQLSIEQVPPQRLPSHQKPKPNHQLTIQQEQLQIEPIKPITRERNNHNHVSNPLQHDQWQSNAQIPTELHRKPQIEQPHLYPKPSLPSFNQLEHLHFDTQDSRFPVLGTPEQMHFYHEQQSSAGQIPHDRSPVVELPQHNKPEKIPPAYRLKPNQPNQQQPPQQVNVPSGVNRPNRQHFERDSDVEDVVVVPGIPDARCPRFDNPKRPVHFPVRGNCQQFVKCFGGTAYTMDCPGGLEFNAQGNRCDYPENARCSLT